MISGQGEQVDTGYFKTQGILVSYMTLMVDTHHCTVHTHQPQAEA